MRYLRNCLFLAIAVCTGCATNGEVKEISSAPSLLTQDELHELLAGHTFPFSNGGIYFASESAATLNWDGKSEYIAWYATDDSKFCYTAKLFGGEEECLGLKRTASGDYLREFDGKTIEVKASKIKEGKSF